MWIWGCGFALALLAACESAPRAPEQASITDEVSVEAAVAAVDKASRAITLERPDGARLVVIAGPEVRNFDRIDAGDTVKASYTVSLFARRLGPEDPDAPAAAEVVTARAAPGERPAGAIGAGFEVTVTVKSVDEKRSIVTFTDPDGMLHAVEAQRDEGKRFVAGLEPGDRVELVYTEVVALSVE